jgi:hypothetical protein
MFFFLKTLFTRIRERVIIFEALLTTIEDFVIFEVAGTDKNWGKVDKIYENIKNLTSKKWLESGELKANQ